MIEIKRISADRSCTLYKVGGDMNKRLYKKIMLSMMVLGVTTSNIVPLHPLAAEPKKSIHYKKVIKTIPLVLLDFKM